MATVKSIKQLARKHGWDLREVMSALSEAGAKAGKILGCGAIGCTFSIGRSKKKVLKLTSNTSEYQLWLQMAEMQQTKHDTIRGVPEVFDAGVIEDAGGRAPAMYVVREAVEPLVKGDDWYIGNTTKSYLFGDLAKRMKKPLRVSYTQGFMKLAEYLSDKGMPITDRMLARCYDFDENVQKLYDLTDVTVLAMHQPSIRDKVWRQTYAGVAKSLTAPFTGLGNVIASILLETGSTWMTDLHMGNIGWRLGQKPEILAYDWLTTELRKNGELV